MAIRRRALMLAWLEVCWVPLVPLAIAAIVLYAGK